MPNQTVRQRQKRDPLSDQEQDRLQAKLNTAYASDILSIARHFGGQPKATSAQIIDIDSKGITLEWEWTEDKRQKTGEMQFAFRSPSGAGSVLKEISELAAESHQALGISDKPKLAKDKEALDAKNMVDFTFRPPSIAIMAGILVLLLLNGYLALVDEIHPALQFIRDYFVSQNTCYYIFVGCLGIHCFEAFLAFSVCHLIKTFQPQQMTTENQVKWTVGGALFGLFCLHDFLTRLRRQFALADAMGGPGLQ